MRKNLNIELLRKMQDYIQSEPRRFRMGWWMRTGKIKYQPNPPCGTTACLAGTALILSGLGEITPDAATRCQATRVLGLSEREGVRLFFLDNWPQEFRQQYKNDGERDMIIDLVPYKLTLKDVKNNARVAIERIDHFIKTRK